MGYTNYYHIKSLEKFPKEFVDGVQKIIDNSPVQLDDSMIIDEHCIRVNGVPGQDCEEFWITAPLTSDCWPFTKTNREPYDLIVKAILILAEHRGDILTGKFSFDGKRKDKEYMRAVRYLKKLNLW